MSTQKTVKTTISSAETVTVSGFKVAKLSHSNYYTWCDLVRPILKYTTTLTGTVVWTLIKGDIYTDSLTGDRPKLTAAQLSEEEDAIDTLRLLITTEIWVEFKARSYTAFDLWHAIAAKFTAQIASRQALLETQVEAITFDEKKESLQAYLDRITAKVTEIRSAGGELSDVTYTGHLLRNLLHSYNTVKVIYNSTRSDVENVKNLLLSNESRQKQEAIQARSTTEPQQNSYTLSANRGGGNRSRGRGRGSSSRGNRSSRDQLTYEHCKKPSYTKLHY